MRLNELYDAANAGDTSAERELYARLAVRLRLIAHQRIWNEDDADDVAQAALLTIIRERNQVAITTSFSAWAYKVLDNKILSYIKRQRERLARAADIDDSEVTGPGLQCDPGLLAQILHCLKKVGRRDMRYARILNLHYQGYSTEEVCGRLKIKRNHMYVVLSRARSLMELCLERGDIS